MEGKPFNKNALTVQIQLRTTSESAWKHIAICSYQTMRKTSRSWAILEINDINEQNLPKNMNHSLNKQTNLINKQKTD